ncbi:MAG TPA: DNA polymerase Y family protein [Arenimonas sp.]|nr:DNA polymerase Y family protein [Arenimonas sp.]
MDALWAAIRLPQLALDAITRRDAAPDTPLALLQGPPQRRGVHSANAAAQAQGVRPGQALAVAQALCPGLRTRPYPEQDAAALRQLLAAWAYRYSSRVCSEDDTLWLEAGASFGLFGPWPRFERLLRDDLIGLGLQHRIALAPTPLGAAWLAQAEDGMAVLDRGQLRNALQRLPLSTSDLPEDSVAALAAVGVRKLRQLLGLPRAGLARRFGRALPEWLDRLLGDAPDPRPTYRPPEHFIARFEFDFEITLSTSLLFPLKRLLGDLAVFLASRDGGVSRFQLRLEHEGRAASNWTVGLATPERDASRLFDLARLRLERETVPAPVVALAIIADDLPPFVPLASDLFDARPAAQLDWAALQARLRARLGDGCLRQLQPVADPRPEFAQRSVPQLQGALPELPPLPRPAWLLPRPLPWPQTAPHLLAGPERIEGGWWDWEGGDRRRDYYIADAGDGRRAWLFCPPGQVGPFMLHGWFA